VHLLGILQTFLHAPAVVSNSSSSHNDDGASGKWKVEMRQVACGLPLNNPPKRAKKKKKKEAKKDGNKHTFRAVKCDSGA